MTATRRAGIALFGMLGVGLAVASGTAFASSGSPAAGTHMAGMSAMASRSTGAVGTTKGWYNGKTVTFLYTRNFFCQNPPASGASSKCVAGPDYTQTPASTFDPLYVVVPLGFTPPKGTLQCPVAGHCIDHPNTIDLSAILGSGTSNALLPPHSHFVATANSGKAEWWNVDVVGVKSLRAWNELVTEKHYADLKYMQKNHPTEITGNITTNLFLYFAVQS